MAEKERAAQYDYVIVGAGSAGCVIARRLSEDADARVLLLEAGAPDTREEIHDPLAWPALWNSEVDWAYYTAPQEHCRNRELHWPRGKVLGGSSSLNGMIYVRGHRSDYDNWAYEGNVGWDYDGVLPLFCKSEDFEGGASEYHGVGGPLHVSTTHEHHPTAAAFIEAARETGYSVTHDFNGPQMEGAGWCHLTVRNGKRQSAAVAFLKPVMDRPNLTVLTGAKARRLMFTGERCTGVEYVQDGDLRRAEAAEETVVCLGTIESPRLLMLSGLGPADDLQRLGLEVRVDLPGVGQNLHDHLLLGVIFEASKPVPEGKVNLLESQMFWRSDSRRIGPDIQPLFMHFPYYIEDQTGPENCYTISPGIVRPVSRGWIRLHSADPDAPMEINPNYLAEDADVRGLLFGIELAREIGAAPAFREWYKAEVFPGEEVRSETDLRRFIAQVASTYHHQVGTCKMGLDRMAVVDPELRVYGTEGLRVVDASIMPSVTSGNINAPTIMIGEKAADMIKASTPMMAAGA